MDVYDLGCYCCAPITKLDAKKTDSRIVAVGQIGVMKLRVALLQPLVTKALIICGRSENCV
jgi:hypothetical protein